MDDVRAVKRYSISTGDLFPLKRNFRSMKAGSYGLVVGWERRENYDDAITSYYVVFEDGFVEKVPCYKDDDGMSTFFRLDGASKKRNSDYEDYEFKNIMETEKEFQAGKFNSAFGRDVSFNMGKPSIKSYAASLLEATLKKESGTDDKRSPEKFGYGEYAIKFKLNFPKMEGRYKEIMTVSLRKMVVWLAETVWSSDTCERLVMEVFGDEVDVSRLEDLMDDYQTLAGFVQDFDSFPLSCVLNFDQLKFADECGYGRNDDVGSDDTYKTEEETGDEEMLFNEAHDVGIRWVWE